MSFSFRAATLDDVPALVDVIARSARGLSRQDYTDAQIEAALGTAWGVDTELIRDGTYFAVEVGGAIIACGGWSKRRTLFGSDAQAGRRSDSPRSRARRGSGAGVLRPPGVGAAGRGARAPGALRARGPRARVPLGGARGDAAGGAALPGVRVRGGGAHDISIARGPGD